MSRTVQALALDRLRYDDTSEVYTFQSSISRISPRLPEAYQSVIRGQMINEVPLETGAPWIDGTTKYGSQKLGTGVPGNLVLLGTGPSLLYKELHRCVFRLITQWNLHQLTAATRRNYSVDLPQSRHRSKRLTSAASWSICFPVCQRNITSGRKGRIRWMAHKYTFITIGERRHGVAYVVLREGGKKCTVPTHCVQSQMIYNPVSQDRRRLWAAGGCDHRR